MTAKKYYFILTLFLIIVLFANGMGVQSVFADGETPTEPPAATEVATEVPATSEPAEPTAIPQESTATSAPILETVTPEAEDVSAETIYSQAPQNTDIVVLDEQGQALALGSQETANALVTSDPVWCPESVSVPTPGANGCSASYSSIADLLAAMQANPANFSQNGTIYLEQTSGAGFTTPLVLDDSSSSLGAAYSTLNIFNLTIQGGWNPSTGSTAGQTAFSGPNAYVQVGSLANPWAGSLTINNISVFGSPTGQDAIQIFASNVALNNITASYSDMNGISITASEAGTVELNNVNASNNGHMEGAEPVGSGVSVNGADTLLTVTGGSFNNNARFGIEAVDSTSSTLPIANVWTDQEDYLPGSVVTISGNDNSLNGNNIGFIFGETVLVQVQGPNGYTATCQATANSFGGWSCQIALWPNALAIGDYTYTAVGLTSAISVTGKFTDAKPQSISVSAQSPNPVTAGNSATYTVTVSFNGTSAACTANLSIITSLPAGASASFSPTSVTSTGADQTSTLTISTTGATPAGSTNFTVQAAGTGGCNGNNVSKNNVTLVVTTVATNTPTNTATATKVNTPTNTPTNTATNTPTNTPTNTATATKVNTPTNTPTNTSTNTPVNTATNTATNTPVNTVTNTATNTPVNTATTTPTNTQTNTPTNTATNTPTNVATNAPINTPTATHTPTSVPTNSSVNTPTKTPTSIPSGGISSSPTSRPKSSQSSSSTSAFIIPLTGGELIDLDCNSIFWAFGVKLTYYNLCDYQTTIHSVGAKELPGKLPTGFTYVLGLDVDILSKGQIVKNLPDGSGIEMDFPLNQLTQDKLALLYWDDPDGDGKGQWLTVSKQLAKDKIFQTLTVKSSDELYKLITSAGDTFYPNLTTDRTGIFILVKK